MYLVNRSFIADETQVRPCTPLVMDPIGTSSTGTDGKSCWNMSRLVCPCSLDTPLDMLAKPQAHDGHVERGVGRFSRRVAELHEVVDADHRTHAPSRRSTSP